MEFAAYTEARATGDLLVRVGSALARESIAAEQQLQYDEVGDLALVLLPASTPSDLARLLGHDRKLGHVQAHIDAWREAGWTPLFWAALNGYPMSMWRWLFRMTPTQARQAMNEPTLCSVTLHT